MDWVVRVPASSANLGSAFDAVALALDVHLEVTAVDADASGAPAPDRSRRPRTIPRCARSVRPAGSARSRSAPASPEAADSATRARRGVGGLVAACVQQGGSLRASRTAILQQAGDLEGHSDNAAASLLGGVVAVAGGRAVRIPLPRDLAVVVWIPDRETSTPSARRLLPDQVSLEDATFNIGRAALLVAALAAGDVDALAHRHRGPSAPGPPARAGARHAPSRWMPRSAAGAYAAWVSGSGPSAAALVDPARAHEIAAALPGDGRTHVVAIAEIGATVTTRDA